jgi:general L-amino acid transport system permease protein
VLGIFVATFLGFLVGVARLSPNFFLSTFASTYIEIFRNTPLLLQIMFWNFAVFLPLFPGPRESLTLGEEVFLNNRGLYLPRPMLSENLGAYALLIAIALGVLAIFAFNRWAKTKQYHTGFRPPGRLYGLATLVVLVFLVFLIFPSPLTFDLPELGRFNLSGGMEVPLPLFSLWFALTTYTAAFIAENVRGGIISVSKGQTEAASSLGLKRPTMLRLVIIPQAMRVIVPPTISQYLNLTKNSSLAVAVGYPELVNVWAGIALNQTGQALVIIAMTILVYEALSLTTSAILNWYNRRVQMVER